MLKQALVVSWSAIAGLALGSCLMGDEREMQHQQPSPDAELVASEAADEFPAVQALLEEVAEAPTVNAGRLELRPRFHETIRAQQWTLLGASVKVLVDPARPNEYDVLGRGARVRVTRSATADEPVSASREGRFVGVRRSDGVPRAVLFAKSRSVEELVRWDRDDPPPSYTLELPKGWHLHRSVGVPSIVEVRDPEKVARLRFRVGPAWDADGVEVAVEPRVSGARIELAAAQEVQFPVLVDPEWSDTGQPAVEHWGGTSTLLNDGRVLVAGGQDAAGFVAEIYDPAKLAFSDAGQMVTSRSRGTATTLLDGRVYLAGGFVGDSPTQATELYDPRTGAFTPAPALAGPRAGHSATRLEDGTVLLVGWAPFLEVVDPAGGADSLFEATTAKWYHTATKLDDDAVLIAGGGVPAGVTDTAQIFEPTTGLRDVSPLGEPRASHAAIRLEDGRVLIAGGTSLPDYTNFVASADIFDPLSETFSPTSPLPSGRWDLEAALLPDGRVLVAGGLGAGAPPGVRYTFFDPMAGAFSPEAEIETADTGSFGVMDKGALVALPGGRFLHVGRGPSLLFDATRSQVAESLTLVEGRYRHASTVLQDGRALLVGGCEDECLSVKGSAEIVSEAPLSTTPTAFPLVVPRAFAEAVLLPSGKVAILGGFGSDLFPVREIEIFDPISETFSVAGQLGTGRWYHTTTLLPDGHILVVGGISDYLFAPAAEAIASMETFDPTTGTSSAAGELATARAGHTTTVLLDGRILMANGFGLASAELHDLIHGSSTGIATGAARGGHVAASLPDGSVALLGGGGSAIEVFDPVSSAVYPQGLGPSVYWMFGVTTLSGDILTGGGNLGIANGSGSLTTAAMQRLSWDSGVVEPFGTLSVPRTEARALLLPSGNVLVAGGTIDNIVPSPVVDLIRDTTVSATRARPTLAAPPSITPGVFLRDLPGADLLGAFEASSGPVPSPTNHPVVTFVPAAGGAPSLGETAPFSDQSLSLRMGATTQNGPGWLFVTVAGARSERAVFTSLGRGVVGARCGADLACESQQCEQGVCCATACDAPCSTCSAPGSEGTCILVEAGAAPPDPAACPGEAASTCGLTGLCDAAGACELHPEGTECAANGSCKDGACVLDACRAHSDCPEGLVCQPSGACVSAPADAPPTAQCGHTPGRWSHGLWLALTLCGMIARRQRPQRAFTV